MTSRYDDHSAPKRPSDEPADEPVGQRRPTKRSAAQPVRDASIRQRPPAAPPKQSPKQSSGRWPASLLGMRWLRSWPLVVLMTFGILGTAGTAAMVSLFRIPNLPNCRAIFWPTASASLRLQCAESYAAQGDVKNLLAAIALVDRLPEDHPLRYDINQRIEEWATQVLDLSERAFEAGNLEEAIASARKIPQKTAAAAVVEERIARWQKIWKEGEDLFNSAVDQLKAKDFQKAFSLLVELLEVDNQYWSTEKYNELTQMISQGREDSRKLSEALGFAKDGTLKGFTEALKRLKKIDEKSVFYAEAQGERKKIAKQMLAAGEDLLAEKKLSDAQAMLSAIPRDVGVNKEVADFQVFVSAYQQAWAGNASGLEDAITRLKTLGKDRPLYARAQQLIAQWQGEIRNVNLLTQSQARADRGSTSDLTAAIAIAEQIPRNSSQWDKAAKQINQWQTRVENAEDRPILERADQLAAVGTADNLRAAIQEARRISSGRTLAGEADERIATWTGRVQRIEDQPLLDQARQRANAGDLSGAITVASRIGKGRALYSSAQEEIGEWQAQENGRLRLGEAVNAAARGDAQSLTNAIEIAQRVPTGSDSRARAESQISRWSWDLLAQAEAVSGRSLESAIALANQIPSQAEAFEPAQVRINSWQAALRRTEDRRSPPATEGAEFDENGLPNKLELTPAGE
ncbi:chromosome segregation ATPase [Leptolyngbya sp. BC1307]|uniref:chromosome segregation ATPase n=1 Tax=Leptolyngbya sp. BC1307 TaxID=2029589 RepID=UPI000EFC2643|nr:chromosome segregation ATPase [Leptolyngbya sp. BC1307]